MRSIFDAHCDTLLKGQSEKDVVSGGASLHLDLPRLLEAGVQDQVMAMCVEACPGKEKEMWTRGIANFQALQSAENVRLHFALEGCLAITNGWEIPFHPLVASLTWNVDNPYAGGIGSLMDLTQEGINLAKKLIDDETALDVSHLNDLSRGSLLRLGFPVCATHCNARKLCEGHGRNLPDQDIVEIAQRGGVIGVTFVPDFLEEEGSKATITSVVNHVEYMAEKTTIDSVGFGSDFDGIPALPHGIEGVLSWQNVMVALEGRGWSSEDIDKVAGGNWRRFFGIDKEIQV